MGGLSPSDVLHKLKSAGFKNLNVETQNGHIKMVLNEIQAIFNLSFLDMQFTASNKTVVY